MSPATAVHGSTWTGFCSGCHRDGAEVASRLSHGLRVLCSSCATRPYSLPRAGWLDGPPGAPANGNGTPSNLLNPGEGSLRG
jgi:hypothetical protein